MSDQIVKHDNSLPGFLLILLPAAFVAVFLSIAWPFILGGVVFLTGNSVWQSYQWAKLSQQVNPYFSQLVLEQQGEIAPLALSARANISAPVADRYLQGKAAEIGGVSYRSDNGGTVYSFLTVNSLENTFAGLRSNESATQKLDYVAVDVELAPVSKTLEKSAPVLSVENLTAPEVVAVVPEVVAQVINTSTQETPAPVTPTAIVVPDTPVVAVTPTQPVVDQAVPAISVTSVAAQPETSTEPVVAPVVQPTSLNPAEIVQSTSVTPVISEAVISTEPVVAKVVPSAPTKPTATTPEATGSSFAQALRGIFDAGNEPLAAETVELEELVTGAETITQVDLAKRLDVHPSTLYKRRSDVSFGEWTRNRDPEGFAWGYQRDTKEFYRLT
jgi:hypothetical protein